MREINRSRYLRGTKAWSVRNWFIFGSMSLTILLGGASVFLFPGLRERVQQKTEDEKTAKLARREKIEAILKRREQLEEAGKSDKQG